MEGKKWMKQIAALLLAAVLLFVNAGGSGIQVQAAAKTVYVPSEAVRDGRYIYYAHEYGGIRMGIMRYDVKTGSQKQIVGYKKNGQETNGYSCLNIDKKYIYAAWDVGYGSDRLGPNYIYRFSKDGKRKEKLARGSQPVLVGDYIYYLDEKQDDIDELLWRPTGYICRMKKDGSNKQRVLDCRKSNCAGLYKYGSEFVYADGQGTYYDLKGKSYKEKDLTFSNVVFSYHGHSMHKVTDKNYQYLVQKGESMEDRKKLYRKNLKTGKKTTLASFSHGINTVIKCGDYLYVSAYIKGKHRYGDAALYILSSDGKFKKKVKRWLPGE